MVHFIYVIELLRQCSLCFFLITLFEICAPEIGNCVELKLEQFLGIQI